MLPADVAHALGITNTSMAEEVKAFQDWVTRVALPAIRKDGVYVMGEETVSGRKTVRKRTGYAGHIDNVQEGRKAFPEA